ncbi:hypothetical protein EGW08_022563 [Elysia chlorotica]|uniref:Trafficking kinesin-binding protein C-terminal domain-containing protein n=1 Tax=Elysia chlorotica TaxID=188477 RepID=A0A433SKM4_ELYCH|nr:hypothetical protein EGW08_022563 [Elysia chlorotica]
MINLADPVPGVDACEINGGGLVIETDQSCVAPKPRWVKTDACSQLCSCGGTDFIDATREIFKNKSESNNNDDIRGELSQIHQKNRTEGSWTDNSYYNHEERRGVNYEVEEADNKDDEEGREGDISHEEEKETQCNVDEEEERQGNIHCECGGKEDISCNQEEEREEALINHEEGKGGMIFGDIEEEKGGNVYCNDKGKLDLGNIYCEDKRKLYLHYHGNEEEEKEVEQTNKDEVFSEAESGSRGSSNSRTNNFAVLFRHCRVERDAWRREGLGGNRRTNSVWRSKHPRLGSDTDNQVLCAERVSQMTKTYNDIEAVTRLLEEWKFLCAERVSQMTKTYNDIEAVTRLLEEKERDLELAARIGQTLLCKNKELSARTEALEEQLSQATERANQLRHEMGMKDELLRCYTEDLERDAGGTDSNPGEKPAVGGVNLEFLEKKVKSLEEENLHLRLESASLQSATSNYEDKEKKLVEDCIQQLAEVNQQVETFASELHIKSEENLHQKEEIKTFLGQIAGLQTKIRKLTLENMDMHEKFTASTESQRKLTKELGMMQDRYDELMMMLEETQDELQLARARHRSDQPHRGDYSVTPDSLASELENSLRQEQLGQAMGPRVAQSWRVFETAKAAKKAAAKSSLSPGPSSTSRMSVSASGDPITGPPSVCESSRLSVCTSDLDSHTSEGYGGDLDSLYESNSELGRPGIPGSNDLDNALRRLATRRANEMNEREFLAREREAQKARKISGSPGDASSLGPHSPNSSFSSGWTSGPGSAQASGGYKISDRLQIVKPMEGSMTLRHWKNLANPHLGGIFAQREGIQMKGERTQDVPPGEAYSISDPEEYDEPHDIHTRREQDQGPIYTFTDSTVQTFGPYPGLGTLFDSRYTPSLANLSASSIGTDRLPFGTSTPKSSSGARVHTSSTPGTGTSKPDDGIGKMAAASSSSSGTYTMSSGLASLLENRESPIVGRSLLRAASIPRLNLSSSSSSSSKTSTACSESQGSVSLPSASSSSAANFLSSSSSSSSSSITASIWKHNQRLPGSGSFDDATSSGRDDGFRKSGGENVIVSMSNPASPRRAAIFTPGMTGQGLLQQLKTKGLSLYGLWSGKPETRHDEDDARTVRLPSGSSIDGLGDGAKDQTSLASVLGEGAMGQDNLASVGREECGGELELESAEASAESIMPGDSGVLGALANFRRSGIL